MDAVRFAPAILGALGWLVGGNIIVYRLARREGLRWPAFPPLRKLTLGEQWLLGAFLIGAMAGFLWTIMLTEP